MRSFAIYILSRGKGVPLKAREVMQRIRDDVEADRARGLAVETSTTRIGIEGESKLCVRYEDAEAGGRAHARAAAVAAGVDLVRVENEPCDAKNP